MNRANGGIPLGGPTLVRKPTGRTANEQNAQPPGPGVVRRAETVHPGAVCTLPGYVAVAQAVSSHVSQPVDGVEVVVVAYKWGRGGV